MDRLPQGIHFRPGERPPDFFRFVTFNFLPQATPQSARDALTEMWSLLSVLKEGRLPDLEPGRPDDPDIRVDAGNLCCVLCLGPRLFDPSVRDAALVPAELRPDRMPRLQPGANRPFPSLHWGATASPDSAQTDFAIQLTADSELAVARPIVELQKLIDDRQLPLRIVCFFSGLHRDDARSWIDFHDGVNNMPSDQRLEAIEVRQDPHGWLVGGTTTLFLKIGIDLQGWRRLRREQQEAIVGRDKLSGCPIDAIAIDAGGAISLHRSDCPPNSEIGSGPGWPADARDPPPAGGLAAKTHIHRANLLRQPPATDGARRIYRQGYEFIDSPPDGGVRVGLNFVSFQRDPAFPLSILRAQDWMGSVNFGGDAGSPQIPAFGLMHVIAGGLFAVPPVEAPFPGAQLFRPAP